MYPYTAWEDSYIHNAFENAGATLSGVETAYKALKKTWSVCRKMQPSNLSHLVVMVVHMISVSSLFPEQWSVITIWCMSATIMEHT